MPIIKANRVILKAVLIEIEAGFLMAKNLVFLPNILVEVVLHIIWQYSSKLIHVKVSNLLFHTD